MVGWEPLEQQSRLSSGRKRLPFRKKLVLGCLVLPATELNPTITEITSPFAMAKHVSGYWSQSFDFKERATIGIRRFLRQHVSPIQEFFSPSVDDYEEFLPKLRGVSSAPGPDGKPACCWSYTGRRGAKLLYDIQDNMVETTRPLDGFNSSFTVFPPKKAKPYDGATIQRYVQ